MIHNIHSLIFKPQHKCSVRKLELLGQPTINITLCKDLKNKIKNFFSWLDPLAGSRMGRPVGHVFEATALKSFDAVERHFSVLYTVR